MNETLRFTLELEIEIDGRRPDDRILNDRIIGAMSEAVPGVLFDDDELDCAVFVNSLQFTREE